MKIYDANIKARALYDLSRMKKEPLADLPDNVVFQPTGWLIAEGKFNNSLAVKVGDLAYYTNDRPLVDSFETIKECFGNNLPKLGFEVRTSQTSGKKYRIFVPVDDEV